jgi:hypothetical protein
MARIPVPTAGASVAREASVARSLTGEGVLETPPRHAAARAKSLDELESQFTNICESFQQLVASAGSDLSVQAPSPGSWSIAQCLQHLNASADAYFSIWQQVISNAGPRREAPSAPYRADFWGRLLSWILEPPPRIRSKTPVPFEPLDSNQVAPVLESFLDRQARIIATLRRCRGRAIDEIKMCSPIDPRLRYSVWSSFLINAAHQRRHLWQAQEALRKLQGAK